MNSSYVSISIMALYFYAFVMLAFLTAKKNQLIRDFIAVLLTMVLWAGGSLLMRLQAWPDYRLWYHVSLAGIWLAPYAYFCFIRDFCGIRAKSSHRLWLILPLLGFLFNFITGWILAAPSIVDEGGSIQFVYEMNWHVVIMYGLCLLIVLHMLKMIGSVRKSPGMISQLLPLMVGALVLYLGNLTLPIFNGFPIDILAGVGNAIIMFYTLYTRQMFKMTLLVSRGNCYITAMGISVLAFYNLAQSLELLIRNEIPMLAPFSVMIVALLTMVITLIIYLLTSRFFDQLFVKNELSQTERISRYTSKVSQSLRLNEILSALVDVINDTLNVKKIYICIRETDGSYPAIHSSSPLDDRNFSMDPGHPLLEWFKTNDSCLLLKDFKRTIEYRSLWETEKHRLDALKIECILPLKDNTDLVGIVLLGGKEGRRRLRQSYTVEDLSYLNSIESVTSIAVKNSRLYEKAYLEARTDELTGLLNRKYFYEALEENIKKCSSASLALIIFNVDDFKLYNELYGNQEGDKALIHIAQIIKGTVGSSGLCSRYSGKEFAVILPDFDIYSAQNIAENISRQIQCMNQNVTDTYLKTITVSCGICAIPYAASTLNELVSNADRAVYHVKRSGKNGILIYSDGIIGKRDADEGLVKKHKSMYFEYAPTICALTAAIDAKDHYTFQHSKNVADYAECLARAINSSEEYREILKEAALLHDIGKIGIPENVLNKKGKLTADEYEVMKRHVESSVEIIRHLPSMDYVIPAVLGHHERYDGQGYPRRIAGKDIPLAARILCIADSFDAMVSTRCYKPSMSVEFAISELENGAGRQFDPELASIFIGLIQDGTIVPNTQQEGMEQPFR